MTVVTLAQMTCDRKGCRAAVQAPAPELRGRARRAGWTTFTSPTSGARYHRCPDHRPQHMSATEETS